MFKGFSTKVKKNHAMNLKDFKIYLILSFFKFNLYFFFFLGYPKPDEGILDSLGWYSYHDKYKW